MACLEMYNNSPSPKQQSPCISPRISFSNDFVESSSHNSYQHSQSEKTPPPPAPVSSDFEFSVTNHNMLCADELFFNGRLLPFKDHSTVITRTLRDELLNDDDDHHHDHDNADDVKTPNNKMGSCKWKGFLGLKRSHIGSKKQPPLKNDDDPATFFTFQPENNTLLSKHPQEMQISSEDPVAVISSDVEMKS